MDDKVITSYLTLSEPNVQRLRIIIKSFEEEEIERLKDNRMKRIVHLVGNLIQQDEDLRYFQDIAEHEGIPMSYDYKKRAVTLGHINRDEGQP